MGGCWASCGSCIGNNADAEDVLQRASMTMWRKFAEFDPARDFFAWASSFAFYEAKNFQRTAARSRLHFDDELMQRLADERVAEIEFFQGARLCVEGPAEIRLISAGEAYCKAFERWQASGARWNDDAGMRLRFASGAKFRRRYG